VLYLSSQVIHPPDQKRLSPSLYQMYYGCFVGITPPTYIVLLAERYSRSLAAVQRSSKATNYVSNHLTCICGGFLFEADF